MISKKTIECYNGASISRGNDFLYILPDNLLQSFISCYTITFPSNMPDKYSILPSASSTIIISADNQKIISTLRGVNTKMCNVGNSANKMKILLLIEFHSGCLFYFIREKQSEFIDLYLDLKDIDKSLAQSIENVLVKSENIETLIISLDKIFLDCLTDFHAGKIVKAIKNEILTHNGNINMSELSSSFFYSEKHIQRLFINYIGTNPKTFSRIVRVNYALQLLQRTNASFTDVALNAGFFDQPHFINDFKSVCGLTPKEYMQNMSVFYNDTFKF